MTQRFSSTHFPYLSLRVSIPSSSTELLVEGLVDTGFDGDLILPESLAGGLNEIAGYTRWRLADGTELFRPYYLASAAVEGLSAVTLIFVSVVGDEVLIGRSFTDRFRLTLDHGREVTLDP